jgi:tryptophan synthase alpha chain
MAALEDALQARRAGGGKCFIPYVTGGYPGVDAELLQGLEAAGADGIEVGIPHSDPVMDGGVIQEASAVALERGASPKTVLRTIDEASLGVPVAVMTYANVVFRPGAGRFLEAARGAGVSGIVVPDLPVDESDEFAVTASSLGIDEVLLAAPGSSHERLREIGARSHGFIYCVATYGVTGARPELDKSARQLVSSLRPLTDLPLLAGVGIGTPSHAAEACSFADGVVVGSAIMERLLGHDRDSTLEVVQAFRAACKAE